jgi:hypothetical protein
LGERRQASQRDVIEMEDEYFNLLAGDPYETATSPNPN